MSVDASSRVMTKMWRFIAKIMGVCKHTSCGGVNADIDEVNGHG